MAIFVKVIRVPGTVKEVGLEDGATVGDALDAADFEVSTGEAITLNGNTVDLSATVTDGSRICLAKSAKSASNMLG